MGSIPTSPHRPIEQIEQIEQIERGPMARTVVLLCGPPGAGKTTAARESGLDVYDRDDPQWHDDEDLFRAEIAKLRDDPDAHAVVIRTAPTSRGRRFVADNIGATRVYLLDAPDEVLYQRIRARDRHDIPGTIDGVRRFRRQFDDRDQVKQFSGWASIMRQKQSSTW